VQITKDGSGRVLKIAGTLDIGVADELQKALREFVSGDSEPIVDLSEVDECDTAALQLLCSARKTANGSGRHCELAGLSASIQNASAALGLSLANPGGDEGAI